VADVLKNVSFTALPGTGHYGASGAGVRITLIDDPAIASVAVAHGQTCALSDICLAAFGINLVDGAVVSRGQFLSFVGVGPGKWLALGDNDTPLATRLQQTFGALAAVCDQSDAYVLFTLEGSRARECMMKGAAIDLDPGVFKVDDAATTVAAHIGLTFWQTSEAPSYKIAVARSFAPSFARHLLAAAAEYGVDFLSQPSSGK
jgi:sarcosine oxidase subunit gamma